MNRPMPNLCFRLMAFVFRLRYLVRPRRNILREVGIEPGSYVLDYACGPGGYIRDLAALVGLSGRIYALDVHPLAIQKVQDIASNNQISNIETICSDCKTGLPDCSIDVVLLYDAFHLLSDPAGVLDELHRILKPNGVLSFSDHHMRESRIVSNVTHSGLFRLSRKGRRAYSFVTKQCDKTSS